MICNLVWIILPLFLSLQKNTSHYKLLPDKNLTSSYYISFIKKRRVGVLIIVSSKSSIFFIKLLSTTDKTHFYLDMKEVSIWTLFIFFSMSKTVRLEKLFLTYDKIKWRYVNVLGERFVSVVILNIFWLWLIEKFF